MPAIGFFPIFGLLFVAVGFYFAIGRFFADSYIRANTRYIRANTRYGVADRRAINFKLGFQQSYTQLLFEGCSRNRHDGEKRRHRVDPFR